MKLARHLAEHVAAMRSARAGATCCSRVHAAPYTKAVREFTALLEPVAPGTTAPKRELVSSIAG